MGNILLITLDDFSNINQSLVKQLHFHFPDHSIEQLEFKPELRKNIPVLILGALAVGKEYFNDFIKGDKSITAWRTYLYHTPYMMKYFNRQIVRRLKSNKFAFVFQTQSLFDGSSQKTPNFIYTDHTNLNNLNYPFINPKKYLCSPRFVEMERSVYQNASLLFVMSNNIKESLMQQYGIAADKIKLVYAGNNARTIESINRGKYARKNILFVGKDWERKGGPLLVEAFKLVQKEIPDVSLTIIGSKPDLSLQNCTIIEETPVEKLGEFYNQASVFCLPTKREPFGIVFIEAMLNRLPIVTNSVGATPELIINNENGYRVGFTARAYADALITLLNDPVKCETFGERSYQIASQNYTWHNTGKLLSQHIKEYLERSDE